MLQNNHKGWTGHCRGFTENPSNEYKMKWVNILHILRSYTAFITLVLSIPKPIISTYKKAFVNFGLPEGKYNIIYLGNIFKYSFLSRSCCQKLIMSVISSGKYKYSRVRCTRIMNQSHYYVFCGYGYLLLLLWGVTSVSVHGIQHRKRILFKPPNWKFE